MIISQTKIFGKQKKKLHPNQISALDKAVKEIVADSTLGELKKGDLQGVKVHKFKMVNQECLLAYTVSFDHLSLLGVGTHENFYRELKKTI